MAIPSSCRRLTCRVTFPKLKTLESRPPPSPVFLRPRAYVYILRASVAARTTLREYITNMYYFSASRERFVTIRNGERKSESFSFSLSGQRYDNCRSISFRN